MSSSQTDAKQPWRWGWQETYVRVLSMVPRAAVISLVGPAVLIVAGYLLWVKYGAVAVDRNLYGLLPDSVHTTEKPGWIKEDVVGTIYRDSHLADVSLVDRDACSSIAMAFRAHPWVARVVRVQKLAGCQVKVDLEYRKPAAWVYHCVREGAPGQPATAIDPAQAASDATLSHLYVVVDSEGVTLPRADFDWDDRRQFVHVYVPDATPPRGLTGVAYRDQRVLDALKLATILEPIRLQLGIERIDVLPPAADDPMIRFELQFFDGRRVYWGHLPDQTVPGELGLEQKLISLHEQLTAS